MTRNHGVVIDRVIWVVLIAAMFAVPAISGHVWASGVFLAAVAAYALLRRSWRKRGLG